MDPPLIADMYLDLRGSTDVNISGKGEPNQAIEILLNGELLYDIQSDGSGAWGVQLNGGSLPQNQPIDESDFKY